MDVASRRDWGARAPRSRRDLTRPRGLAVHWAGGATGLDTDVDHDRCERVIRGQQDFHMDVRGWVDLAYNFLACPHLIFVARGWGVRSAAQGTTFGNDNYHAVQVMIGGNEKPTSFQLAAVRWLSGQHHDRYGRTGLRPHRSFKATACPGPDLTRWVAAGGPAPEVEPEGRIMFDTLIGLERGDSGPLVQYLQYILNQRHHATGRHVKITVDGKFGGQTQRAIEFWSGLNLQASNMLEPEHAARLAKGYVADLSEASGTPGPQGPRGEQGPPGPGLSGDVPIRGTVTFGT